jgi:hypothetical protein
MNDVVIYEVVLFQSEQDGIAIFRSKDLEECKAFAKKEREQFKGFVEDGFPVESLPEFVVVAYYSDQNAECLDV